eukprot:7406149-Pyramimonas_sp.AAC.1
MARYQCPITTLSVEMWNGDAAVAIGSAIIEEWINLWQRFPDVHHRVLESWPHIRRILVALGP